MKKIILVILFVLMLQSSLAIQFGNETQNPSIDINSFKMMIEPQLDSALFIQLRLVNDSGVPLENYHTELKIYDNRGVKVYPGECGVGCPFDSKTAFSDSNGFINYSILLNSCDLFSGVSNCFQLDANYTVTITGKNIFREEFFTTRIKRIQTNWAGDFMRFAYLNIQSFFIILIAFILTVFVILKFFNFGKKGGS